MAERVDARSRTWDGLEIATTIRSGRRRGAPDHPAGVLRCSLLHRSAPRGRASRATGRGPAPPAAASRESRSTPPPSAELAEEAGIARTSSVGGRPVGGGWALFRRRRAVPDVAVELVDPEHDRFEWVRARPRRLARVLPGLRGRAAGTMPPRCPRSSRRSGRWPRQTSAPVVRWQSAPHVATWWDPAAAMRQAVRARYAPRASRRRADPDVGRRGRTAARSASSQDYRVRDQPDYAVQDRVTQTRSGSTTPIGDVVSSRRGIGTRMVWEFCREVLHRDYPDAEHFLASPSHRNLASLRVLAKCGFTQGLWIEPPPVPARPRIPRSSAPSTSATGSADAVRWLS